MDQVAAIIFSEGFPRNLWPEVAQLRDEIVDRMQTLSCGRNNSPPVMFFCLWDVLCWLLASAPADVREAALDLFGKGITEENIRRFRR